MLRPATAANPAAANPATANPAIANQVAVAHPVVVADLKAVLARQGLLVRGDGSGYRLAIAGRDD